MEENILNGDDSINSGESLNLDELSQQILEPQESKEKKSFFSFFGSKKKKNENIEDKSEEIIDLGEDNNSNSNISEIFYDNKNIVDNIEKIEVNETPTSIIDKKENNIFSELDFSDIDFGNLGDTDILNTKKQLNKFDIISLITTFSFWILLILIVGSYLNIYIKTTDNDFITSIPGVCSFIGSSIDGYDNSDCKTLPNIISDYKDKKIKLEDNIVKGMQILIPSVIETSFILNSQEVKFIQEKNANKINYNKVFDDFETLRKSVGGYDGKNIECSGFKNNSNGELSVSCDFYGASIGEGGDTSRIVALSFLDKINSTNSNFSLMDIPNTLDISKYNSTDGIKSIFSTITSLNLKLKYNLSSNKN